MTTRTLTICALAGLLIGVLSAGCRTAPAAVPPPTATTGLPAQPAAVATTAPAVAAATATSLPAPEPATAEPAVDTRLVFTSYQKPAVDVVPAVTQPAIAPDLGN